MNTTVSSSSNTSTNESIPNPAKRVQKELHDAQNHDSRLDVLPVEERTAVKECDKSSPKRSCGSSSPSSKRRRLSATRWSTPPIKDLTQTLLETGGMEIVLKKGPQQPSSFYWWDKNGYSYNTWKAIFMAHPTISNQLNRIINYLKEKNIQTEWVTFFEKVILLQETFTKFEAATSNLPKETRFLNENLLAPNNYSLECVDGFAEWIEELVPFTYY